MVLEKSMLTGSIFSHLGSILRLTLLCVFTIKFKEIKVAYALRVVRIHNSLREEHRLAQY